MTALPQMHRTAGGAARLRALTDAATDMFLDHGYEAASLDALIAQVGGSRRNIYDRFGGKEGLFIEVVTGLCADLAQPLEDLEIDDETVDGALKLFGRQLLGIVLRPRTLALHRLMIAEGRRFPALSQAIWRAGHDNAARILAGWIARQQVSGQLRSLASSTDLAAQFIGLLTTGPQTQALVGLAPTVLGAADVAQLTDLAVETFLAGLLPRETRNDA